MSSSSKSVRYTVHPGVVMAQAIIENLKQKTGRSLRDWVALLKQEGPPDTKARLAWLKSKHGLGGTTARLIVESAEGRGEENVSEQAYLAAAERHVEEMYSGPKESLRSVYGTLLQHALALGADVKVSPAKTMVPLYRNRVFAQFKPTTRTRLDLGLALKGVSGRIPKRLVDTGGLDKGDRITHRIALQSKKAFPDNFKAYAVACEHGEVRAGRMFVFEAGRLTNPRYIINFPRT